MRRGFVAFDVEDDAGQETFLSPQAQVVQCWWGNALQNLLHVLKAVPPPAGCSEAQADVGAMPLRLPCHGALDAYLYCISHVTPAAVVSRKERPSVSWQLPALRVLHQAQSSALSLYGPARSS